MSQDNHTTTVEILKYDREVLSPQNERNLAVVETRLEEKVSGGMAGLGHATHLPTEHPDGIGNLMCIERFEGCVDGRSGTWVLRASGDTDGPRVIHRSHEVVVPD